VMVKSKKKILQVTTLWLLWALWLGKLLPRVRTCRAVHCMVREGDYGARRYN
jgi:hypothetical protein